eukprot:5190207-Pyramimonas_sp.AAC.1
MPVPLIQSIARAAGDSRPCVGQCERSTSGRRLSGFSRFLFGADADAMRQWRGLDRRAGWRSAPRPGTEATCW